MITDEQHAQIMVETRRMYALIGAAVGGFYAAVLAAGLPVDDAAYQANLIREQLIAHHIKGNQRGE